MGVLEFFGTLIRNDITATAIKTDFKEKMNINHLLVDFNSIIHTSSQAILLETNVFMQMVLKNIYQKRPVTGEIFTENFKQYGMENIQKKININTTPEFIIGMFHAHFNEKKMDKLVIIRVINTLLNIIRTYCRNQAVKTLLLAIDGVPSKGKMIEQRQRRYIGAISSAYEKVILQNYRDYLLKQDDYIYLATKDSIKWSRNKITPGTAFMHKLVRYLRSDKIQAKMRINRQKLEIIVSDMYEIGEGEKKIVNYVKKFLNNTDDTVVVYSPDADMILLCMLLPVKKIFMLRHNQQTSAQSKRNIYDIIDISMLKNNISYYINNNPNYAKEKFDSERINFDLVCISTLFGNDFVPKIETLNVKKGFQNIMDAYLQSLIKLKDKGYYLVKKNDNGYRLNFVFLKTILRNLVPEENDFIKYNDLYREYITVGQIKNVFDYVTINSENIVSTYNEFRNEYEKLKHAIKNNQNTGYYESYDQFMSSLKKSINVVIDGQSVNTTYLKNRELIKVLQNYYRKNREFPRLNINLNTYSHSLNDPHHQKSIKDKNFNAYQKEIYRFQHMLDQYYIKFNAQPLNLSNDKIDDYYREYFGIELFTPDSTIAKNKLTPEANQVMRDYLEGLLWVFDYYFNDDTYINRWYYIHERAPLMQHLLQFLESVDSEYVSKLFDGLDKYHVQDLKSYFNPLEQLMYVSPMTTDIIKLLPKNYQKYLMSDNLDPFLKNYFIDINLIVKKLANETVSSDIDCRSMPFFNKCFVKTIHKPTAADDRQFLKSIRKVPPSAASIRRSQNKEPPY